MAAVTVYQGGGGGFVKVQLAVAAALTLRSHCPAAGKIHRQSLMKLATSQGLLLYPAVLLSEKCHLVEVQVPQWWDDVRVGTVPKS